MDIKEIKELIELVNSSELAYFEVSSNDMTIKMDKSLSRSVSDNYSLENNSKVQEITNNVIDNNSNKKIEVENIQTSINNDEDIEVIKSPMVGTFYSSSAPDKDSFVSVGSKVIKGTVLCIIEAMKLMNEIESDFDGEVIEIMGKDGEMVEYGQPIFKIRRS